MATEHDERDDARAPAANVPDESGFAETRQSGPNRPAERVGPWNSQCERFAQSIILAARLGGGGNITFRYGGMVAEVEVKHMKAAEPQLVQRTREVRLDALAMQQEKMQALQKAAAEKAAAKKEKRQRQKERRRAAREQQPPQAEEARDTEAAEEPAEVSAESAGEVKKLKSLLLQRSEQLKAALDKGVAWKSRYETVIQENAAERGLSAGEGAAGRDGAASGPAVHMMVQATSGMGGMQNVKSQHEERHADDSMEQG